jgi:ribose 5-phosphate isomerase B
MTIGLAADHAGFELKEHIKSILETEHINYKDFGTFSPDSCDYADFGHLLAHAVEQKDVDFGIAVCGSGNGIAMALNKHQGIRAALCRQKEIAELARQHNDANILVLPARFISHEDAVKCIGVFFHTSFEGGRHQRRINKIPLEKT